jgi:hypothetical protein
LIHYPIALFISDVAFGVLELAQVSAINFLHEQFYFLLVFAKLYPEVFPFYFVALLGVRENLDANHQSQRILSLYKTIGCVVNKMSFAPQFCVLCSLVVLECQSMTSSLL